MISLSKNKLVQESSREMGTQGIQNSHPSEAFDGVVEYERLALTVGKFLLHHQVVAGDLKLFLHPIDANTYAASSKVTLLGCMAEPICLEFEMRRGQFQWELWIRDGGLWSGPIKNGELFRVGLNGAISRLPGFVGNSRIKNLGPDACVNTTSVPYVETLGWESALKLMVKRIPFCHTAYNRIKCKLYPEVPEDLTGMSGVTFRWRHMDVEEKILDIESYDHGGIFDSFLNAEGYNYPPQVAGNYYADAYSALLFAWLYRQTGTQEFRQASISALCFVKRVYPQYLPAKIVWHHSDFKNPAYMEALEILLELDEEIGDATGAQLRALYHDFCEDQYSPTNVFALRYHWYATRNEIVKSGGMEVINKCLCRLQQDQTAEGLFHDNAPTYPDAHDLTYHQYTLACLAQGLMWKDNPTAKELFIRGVWFSLQLVTPDGEIAYVGRGANNVYHFASTILAFEFAANLSIDNPILAGQFRRAAKKLCQTLARWQQPNGMLPTAMNNLVNERVAWNHCETPYNALSASFLMKASHVANQEIEDSPFPMENNGHFEVFEDSAYAGVRTSQYYAVLFGGCAQSYAWSEGMHRTGLSGLAQLGLPGVGPFLPILDHPTMGNEPPMNDQPIINGIPSYESGTMRKCEASIPGIVMKQSYGNAIMERLYLFLDTLVVVITRVFPEQTNQSLAVCGIVSMPMRCDPGWTFHCPTNGTVVLEGPGGRLITSVLYTSSNVKMLRRVSKTVTNPRGLAARVDLADGRHRSGLAPIITCHSMWLGRNAEHYEASVSIERIEENEFAIVLSTHELRVCWEDWPQVQFAKRD